MGRRFLHANFKHTATSAIMQLVHGSGSSSTMQGARRALASSALMASLARSGVSSTSMLAATAMPLLRAAAPFSIQAATAVTAPTTNGSDSMETATGASSSGSGRTVGGPSSASSGALTVVTGEDGEDGM